MERSWKVCVVGGGIIGLASAWHIRDLSIVSRPIDVTVISDLFNPEVTSSVAAGFWEPYSVGGQEQELLVKKWALATWDHVKKLNCSSEAAKAGTCLLFGYTLLDEPDPNYYANWRDVFFNFKEMNEKELAMFPPHRYGYSYTTLLANPVRYMPWLTEKLKAKNVKFVKRRIDSFEELASDYDVIVNCTGVGAASLLNDHSLQPGRGQVIKVQAPWVKHHITVEKQNGDMYYILPCPDFVVLGGTNQKGNSSMEVSEDDKRYIWEGCCKLIPSLKDAKIIEDRVGLRPIRDSIRLEPEHITTRHGRKWVVHNYGHGGSGITCHWGCGQEAAELVKGCLEKIAFHSKL